MPDLSIFATAKKIRRKSTDHPYRLLQKLPYPILFRPTERNSASYSRFPTIAGSSHLKGDIRVSGAFRQRMLHSHWWVPANHGLSGKRRRRTITLLYTVPATCTFHIFRQQATSHGWNLHFYQTSLLSEYGENDSATDPRRRLLSFCLWMDESGG